MTILIWIIVLLIGSSYCGLMLLLSYGWRKNVPCFDVSTNEIKVSVIIAARNEEEHIGNLLDDLARQSYPSSQFDVVIIDDSSEDKTVSIVQKFADIYPNMQLITLSDGRIGKKAAIDFGIHQASSDILLTTDADCRVGTQWISVMVSYYSTHKPVLLSGPVRLSGVGSFWSAFQELEFESLIAAGAGAIGINRAIMCNGANLLFEKRAYMDMVNTYAHIPSGDDIFLMLDIKKRNRKAIHFLKSMDAVVSTAVKEDTLDFLRQRKRWTSKSKAYRDGDVIITSALVFLVNLLLCISALIVPFSGIATLVFLVLFSLKSSIDLAVLLPHLSFFKRMNLMRYYFPVQLLYILYIPFIAIYGNLGSVKWKGRKWR